MLATCLSLHLEFISKPSYNKDMYNFEHTNLYLDTSNANMTTIFFTNQGQATYFLVTCVLTKFISLAFYVRKMCQNVSNYGEILTSIYHHLVQQEPAHNLFSVTIAALGEAFDSIIINNQKMFCKSIKDHHCLPIIPVRNAV